MKKDVKTIITYIANDGKKFSTEKECIAWENGEKLNALKKYLQESIESHDSLNKEIQKLKSSGVGGIAWNVKRLKFNLKKFNNLMSKKKKDYCQISNTAKAISDIKVSIYQQHNALLLYRRKLNKLGEDIKNRKAKILEMEQELSNSTKENN